MNNIFWFNIKRLKSGLFWRIVLCAINFLLFFSAFIVGPVIEVRYFLLLASLSNILFVYILISNQTSSITLMRSLGASKLFIVVDNMVEVMIEILFPAIIAGVIMLFKKPLHNPLILIAEEVGIVLIVILLVSALTISGIEKQNKEI